MDMRNVAVGVVMEVIATTTVMQPVPEEEASQMLVLDGAAVVLICPSADNSKLTLPIDQCEWPMGDIGARAGTAIAV